MAMMATYTTNAQDKYVYNEFGKLRYIVSDTLSVNENLSEVCLMTEYRDTAFFIFGEKRCGYSESTTYIIRDGNFTFHKKAYAPILFGKEVKLSSMQSFLAYLNYVESKYPDSYFKVIFDYADPRADLAARVVFDRTSWKWKFVLNGNIYKIDAVSNIKRELQQLINAYIEL